ncbi:MAG: hypothetical protein DMG58_24875 [Acidobacteria bacterium]|nr:MAG: hypothetical protein DMG58_24875 [Acidobacteriota bacterium]
MAWRSPVRCFCQLWKVNGNTLQETPSLFAAKPRCDSNSSLNCAGANPGSLFQQVCASPSSTAHSDFPSPVAATDLPSSLVRYSAIGGGSPGFSSTVTSASYYVNEATIVPEPSPAVFVGMFLLGIAAAGVLRRRKA